jgi:proteic killer suppression protein
VKFPHTVRFRTLAATIYGKSDAYGNHLEALNDDRKGQHSIRVSDQWRICFRWHGEDALDVEIVDYH